MRWVVELPGPTGGTAATVTVDAESWLGALNKARGGISLAKYHAEIDDDGTVRVLDRATRDRFTVKQMKAMGTDAPRAASPPPEPPLSLGGPSEAPLAMGAKSESPLSFGAEPEAPLLFSAPPPAAEPLFSSSSAPKAPAPTATVTVPSLSGKSTLAAHRESVSFTGGGATSSTPPVDVSSKATLGPGTHPDNPMGRGGRAARSSAPEVSKPASDPPSSARQSSPSPAQGASPAAQQTSSATTSSTPAAVVEPTPAPTVVAEAPKATPVVTEAPAPVVEAAAPVVEAPAPVVEAPAPVVEAPAPVVEAAAPVVEAAAPVVEAAAPVVEAAAPVVEAAAPVVEAPKSDTPLVAAPEPVAEAPRVEVARVETPAEPVELRSVNGSAHENTRSDTMVIPTGGDDAASLLPIPTVLYERDDDPNAGSPITYRERVFAVSEGTSVARAEALARHSFAAIKRSLATRPRGRFVTIAVFDHEFKSRPSRPPLVVLRWKDWRGEPEVELPDRAAPVVAEVAPVVAPPVVEKAPVPPTKPVAAAQNPPPTVPQDTREKKLSKNKRKRQRTNSEARISTSVAKGVVTGSTPAAPIASVDAARDMPTQVVPVFVPPDAPSQTPAAKVESAEPVETAKPAEVAKPVEAPVVVEAAKPAEVAKPVEAPVVEAAKPVEAPVVEAAKPVEAPVVEAAKPAEAPVVEAAKPAEAPVVEAAPAIVEAAKPAEAPAVADASKPAEAPAIVEAAKPAEAPAAETAKVVEAPAPEAPKPVVEAAPVVEAKPVEAASVVVETPPAVVEKAPEAPAATQTEKPAEKPVEAAVTVAEKPAEIRTETAAPVAETPASKLATTSITDDAPAALEGQKVVVPARSSALTGRRRRGKDLVSDLFDALMDLSFAHTAEDACSFAARVLRETVSADACSVGIYDIDRDEFVLTAAEGVPVDGARVKARGGHRGSAVRKHGSVNVKTCEAPEAIHAAYANAPALFAAAYHRDRLFAMVVLQRVKGGPAFESDEEDGVNYVAAQLAEALSTHSRRAAAAEYHEESKPVTTSKPPPKRR